MIGAMVAFSVINLLVPTGLPPLAIVLIGAGCAVPICMLVGYGMERLAYRPLRHAPRLAAHHRDRRLDHPAARRAHDLEPQHPRVSADHSVAQLLHRRRGDHHGPDRDPRHLLRADGEPRHPRLSHPSARRCAPRRKTRRSPVSWASTSTA